MSTCCSKRSRESAPGLIVSNHRYPAHSYVITTCNAHCEQVVLNLLAQHHPVQRISSSAFMIEGVHVTTRSLVLMTLTLRATRNIAWTGNILLLKLILSSIADVFGSIDYDLFCSGQATPLIWPLLWVGVLKACAHLGAICLPQCVCLGKSGITECRY